MSNDPQRARRHELRFTPSSNLATCRCGDWAFFDRQRTERPLSHESVKKNYELHRKMVQLPATPTGEEPHASFLAEHVSTFPEQFLPMRDHFIKQALQHPVFRSMTPMRVMQSIENRLWTIICQRQEATGKQPEPREFILK